LLNEWQANSSYTYIRIFSTIALFILLLACINYMNLATSKSLQRAGEVGIRKAMGSYRSQLVSMFFGESLLTVGVAIFLGLALAQASMVLFFNHLLNKTLSVDFFIQGINLVYLVMGWIVVSAFAGIYPAVYISSFNTIKALKGKAESIGSALGLRKGLVTFQFFISALLLVGTFVVIQQTDFLQNKDLGFERDHIITIPLEDDKDRTNYQVLKDKMLNQSFVKNISVSAALPYGEGFFDWEIVPEGYQGQQDLLVKTISTDEDFLKTYDIRLLAGRDLSKDIISDKEQGFIINQALARQLDWNDPVGKDFQLTFYTNGPHVRKGKVIGLVEDFHFQSLHNKIEPLVIFINTHEYYTDFLSVRLEGGNIGDQIESLRNDWAAFSPDRPFEFSFLDESLGKLYERDLTTSKLLSIFTGLSIIISCLGLFGLASFTVQQRTKEIGVRKVLGASALSIIQLLSLEFIMLVIVANILAWPLAWYGITQWLSRFAYHVEVGPFVFAVTTRSGRACSPATAARACRSSRPRIYAIAARSTASPTPCRASRPTRPAWRSTSWASAASSRARSSKRSPRRAC
jgi:putative ABC transport system permease protein